MMTFLYSVDVFAQCRSARLKFWHCPPFLFLVLGFITISAMIGTYLLATRYTREPELAALVVILIATLFVVVGNLIINGFQRMLEAGILKTEFINILSHQLRSPLSVSKWTLEALGRRLKQGVGGEIIQEASSQVHNLEGVMENMILLVNSFMEVNSIESGELKLAEDQFSLSEITGAVVASVQSYASDAEVKIQQELEEALPPVVADKKRVEMILRGFLQNAINYSQRGGKIFIRLKRKGGRHLYWSIRDEGVGIPLLQQKHIFERFFRADNIKKLQIQGSGINLYVAKAIIETSGGTMGFVSEENRGSTFWFTLPVVKEK